MIVDQTLIDSIKESISKIEQELAQLKKFSELLVISDQNTSTFIATDENIGKIQQIVARYFKVEIWSMVSRERGGNNVSHPRMIAMAICSELNLYSYNEIGKSFGKRDHGTVMHAHKKITGLPKNDHLYTPYQILLAECKKALGIQDTENVVAT